MQSTDTVIINTAGRGSRLNLGIPKSLIEISGKTLIEHHLGNLTNHQHIRVVVGYKAEDVITIVKKIRKDVIFVFNHRFSETNTLHSLLLGAKGVNGDIVSLDGDLLVAPQDIKVFLKSKHELVGYTNAESDEPVYVSIRKVKSVTSATTFSREKISKYEWTGLVKIQSKKLRSYGDRGHVYQAIEPHLPIRATKINCAEIDTLKDYEYAVKWASNNL